MASGAELKALISGGSAPGGGPPASGSVLKAMVRGEPKRYGNLAFTNRAIAEMIGGPVDLVAFGLRKLGLDIEDPVGGSASVAGLMGAAGIETTPPGTQPQNTGQYISRGVGEAAGALLPFGAAAKVASVATNPVVRGVGQTVGGTAARRPVTTLGGELAAGAGAGIGRQYGDTQYPDDPGKQALAEILGGVTAAVAPGAAIGVAKRTPGVSLATRAAQKAVFPFTSRGGTVRASDRLTSLAADPDEAARRLAQPTEGNLTPAQQTGDRRLMALERAVADADSSLDQRFALRRTESTRALRGALDEIRGPGDVSDARAFVGGRLDRLTALLNRRVEQAGFRAQQSLEKMRPQQRRSQSSTIVREELDAALRDARRQEKQLWEAIPQDEPVPTTATRAAYENASQSLPRAQRDNIPEKARRFLDPVSNERFADTEPVKELEGLYSELRAESRRARAAGEFNAARIADDIADAALEDLGARSGADEVGAAFNAAREWSAQLNQKFRRGAVGRLLGYAREGGASVAPEMTLDVTTGRGGTRALVDTQNILEAVGEGPEATRNAIDQFLRQRFVDAAVERGQVNANQASRFVKNNQEVLDQFPTLRDQMLDAGQAQRIADYVGRRAGDRAKKLQNPNVSHAAAFLDAPVDREIDTILKAKNPTRAARELRRQTAKDAKATRGIKAGFVDHLIGKATTRQFDDQLEPILSGRALLAAMKDNRVKSAAKVLLTPTESTRLVRIANELMRLETAQGGLPNVGGIINDTPNTIISLIGRTLAARAGARAGSGTSGASLLTAQFASQRMRNLLGGITNDKAAELIAEAVQDGELMQSLLRNIDIPSNRRVVNRRMQAWLAGPGARFIEDDDGSE